MEKNSRASMIQAKLYDEFVVGTVFCQLNAGGVYLKLGLVDPAFFYQLHFQPSIFLISVPEVH